MDVIDSFATVTTLPFDAAAQSVFGGLAARTPSAAPFDLRIASIALVHGLTLLTRYADDFAGVPGLRTEDWTK